MIKIISLFERNYETDRLVRDEVVSGAEWVINGEGIATRKFDGTCCLIRDGHLFKRYDAKHGKTPPPHFIPAQPAPDPTSGHWPGWLQIQGRPEDKWHVEAWRNLIGVDAAADYDEIIRLTRELVPDEQTYELLGPRINQNPEGFDKQVLIPHGCQVLTEEPDRHFFGIAGYLSTGKIEGIVYHHPDGRMVKIKAKDFGFKRQPPPMLFKANA